MKKIFSIYTIFGLAACAPVAGQTFISLSPAAGSAPVKVNVSVDNRPLDNRTANMNQPGNKSPRNVVWIEYGDGAFTTNPESEHQFYDNRQSNWPVMLVKSTGIYDKGGKPPKHTAKKIPPEAKNNRPATGSLVLYNDEESVRITPNVADVAGGDTMMMALTYRRPRGAPAGLYRLLFFYNMDGMQVFEPVKTDGGYRVFDDAGEPVMVPNIRTHHGEQLIAPRQLPEAVYQRYKKDFRSAGFLVFNVNISDDRERHLFLTLVPRQNLPANSNLAVGMNLEIVPPDNKPKGFNYASRLVGNLGSHDPNWQEVFPKCIELPKKNQVMKHHIHFQNTGLGPARKVVVKTALPTGLTANDIEVTGWKIAGEYNNPNFQLKIDRSHPDSIVFEFTYDPRNTRIVLYGALDLPDAHVNPKTMGDIYFTCKAKPGTPMLMSSGTSIYFDANEAVKTEPANVEFKKCCDCDKDCDKYKSKFAKWLFCKEC